MIAGGTGVGADLVLGLSLGRGKSDPCTAVVSQGGERVALYQGQEVGQVPRGREAAPPADRPTDGAVQRNGGEADLGIGVNQEGGGVDPAGEQVGGVGPA